MAKSQPGTLPDGFRPEDVQGNILRGYHYARVRHVILEVRDAAAARRWLGATLAGGMDMPQITSEVTYTVKPVSCFNLSFTAAGLRALGVSEASLKTFPDEFTEGMPGRAVKLGDVGDSAPAHWDAPFADPDKVHVFATINADEIAELDRVQAQLLAFEAGRGLGLLTVRDGWNFDKDLVHFGYKDSISQPRFAGIHDPDAWPDDQPQSPIGAMLIGYPTEYEGLLWNVPQPDALGRNACFAAFRVLEQDIAAFEDWLTRAATFLEKHPLIDELQPPQYLSSFGPGVTRHAALREVVAAVMCGRWRNGVPMELSPYTPNPDPQVSLTDFDYGDPTATPGCPWGAHTRRCNPRGGAIVQRAANHTRRVVRRGVPYGPAWDPARPDEKRGLLGVFLCANLGAQFEALQCDWLNLGLQDPRITGSHDPLLGANVRETSYFQIPLPSGKVITLSGFPRFVRMRGGAYTVIPGIPAIRYLAGL
jgi:deferrochelatase/peroxidase EfeB